MLTCNHGNPAMYCGWCEDQADLAELRQKHRDLVLAAKAVETWWLSEPSPSEVLGGAPASIFLLRSVLAGEGEPVPTDEEIIAWADVFIRDKAFNRGVAVEIAIAAAKWVRSFQRK